jgi:hypothetical protein
VNAAQPKSGLIQITGQKRNENQSTGEIAFTSHPLPAGNFPSSSAGIVASLAALISAALVGARRLGKKVPRVQSKGDVKSASPSIQNS